MPSKNSLRQLALVSSLAVCSTATLSAQTQVIRATSAAERVQILPGVYRVMEPTRSLLVVLGRDGPLIVGTQSPSLVAKARALLSDLDTPRVRYVLMISEDSAARWGAGGWERDSAITIVHENLRFRILSAPEGTEVPGGVPVFGFSEVLQLVVVDDDIHIVHQPGAHSNADVSVHFEKRRFLYLGPLLTTDGYPVIDVRRAGSIDGLIAAADNFITRFGGRPELVEPIVPARGPLATMSDLRAYHAMLVAVRDRIEPLVRQGKPLREVIASRPTVGLDSRWGRGPVTPDQFVTMVYESLARKMQSESTTAP